MMILSLNPLIKMPERMESVSCHIRQTVGVEAVPYPHSTPCTTLPPPQKASAPRNMKNQRDTNLIKIQRIFLLGFSLMLMYLLTVTEGSQKKCWTRSQQIQHKKVVKEGICNKPKATLMPLAVPPGFHWVFPSVVMTNHCSRSMCQKLNVKCVALQSSNHSLRVQAFKIDPSEGHQCLTLPYEEHIKCGCRCDQDQEDCGMMEEFNAEMCRCECKHSARQQCIELMKAKNSMKMWDEKSCTCPCGNSGQDCGSGAMWVPDMCRCVRVMDMDGGDSANEI